MNSAISSVIALSIVAAVVYFYPRAEAPPIAEAPAVIAVVAPAEIKPEPFAYAEAVMPSFVPVPKPRPHRRHLACKPVRLTP